MKTRSQIAEEEEEARGPPPPPAAPATPAAPAALGRRMSEAERLQAEAMSLNGRHGWDPSQGSAAAQEPELLGRGHRRTAQVSCLETELQLQHSASLREKARRREERQKRARQRTREACSSDSSDSGFVFHSRNPERGRQVFEHGTAPYDDDDDDEDAPQRQSSSGGSTRRSSLARLDAETFQRRQKHRHHRAHDAEKALLDSSDDGRPRSQQYASSDDEVACVTERAAQEAAAMPARMSINAVMARSKGYAAALEKARRDMADGDAFRAAAREDHGPHGGAGGAEGGERPLREELGDVTALKVDPTVTFASIGGLPEQVLMLREMVLLPLLYPDLLRKLRLRPPRGVLFTGPPGTGKTLMARALANEGSRGDGRRVTFFMRKGADILSKWVGESERQLRLLFDEARRHEPAIIFFDEIDGLAPVRHSKQEQSHAALVSTLLALLDGLDDRGQVIVIGATNRPDTVDPALRRPSRFDRELVFPLPDAAARRHILDIVTAPHKHAPPAPGGDGEPATQLTPTGPPATDAAKGGPATASPAADPVDVRALVGLTEGFSGADLAALSTEAGLCALRRCVPQIYADPRRLAVDPAAVAVRMRDYTAAVRRLQPTMRRAASSATAGLPPVPPLLEALVGDDKAALRGALARLWLPATEARATAARPVDDLAAATAHLTRVPLPPAPSSCVMVVVPCRPRPRRRRCGPAVIPIGRPREHSPTEDAHAAPPLPGAPPSPSHQSPVVAPAVPALAVPTECAPWSRCSSIQPEDWAGVAHTELSVAHTAGPLPGPGYEDCVTAAAALAQAYPTIPTRALHLPLLGAAAGAPDGTTPGFLGGAAPGTGLAAPSLGAFVEGVVQAAPCIALLLGFEQWAAAADAAAVAHLVCHVATMRRHDVAVVIPATGVSPSLRRLAREGPNAVTVAVRGPTPAALAQFFRRLLEGMLAQRTATVPPPSEWETLPAAPAAPATPERKRRREPVTAAERRTQWAAWRRVQHKRAQLRYLLSDFLSTHLATAANKFLLHRNLDLTGDELERWRAHYDGRGYVPLLAIADRLESGYYTSVSGYNDDIDTLAATVRTFFSARDARSTRQRLRAAQLRDQTIVNNHRLSPALVAFCEVHKDDAEPSDDEAPPTPPHGQDDQDDQGDDAAPRRAPRRGRRRAPARKGRRPTESAPEPEPAVLPHPEAGPGHGGATGGKRHREGQREDSVAAAQSTDNISVALAAGVASRCGASARQPPRLSVHPLHARAATALRRWAAAPQRPPRHPALEVMDAVECLERAFLHDA